MARMIRKILIANRGEIACRIAATCRRLGIISVAVYSDADRDALHVRSCDEAIAIGPAEASRSYLLPDRLVSAAMKAGADAIHPGYGFLSESPDLRRSCASANLIFIGPPLEAIVTMGSKRQARRLAAELNVATIPGYDGDDQSDSVLIDAARAIGFPLLIKASAGGGGKGIRVVESIESFSSALDTVRREGLASFADDSVLMERFVPASRHIEVQILGDTRGNVIHLFDRECSLQRRHQKVIEEAPAPLLPDRVRQQLYESAISLAKAVNYCSLGTVEFLYDPASEQAFFLEMNTRIQVEHPVTEMVTGLDLVELQICVAEGRQLPLVQSDIGINGHAIEARLNAEEPERGFMPAIGCIDQFVLLADIGSIGSLRVDTGVGTGSVVTPYYDSMIAKLIVWAPHRESARQSLVTALNGLVVNGIATNSAYLQAVLNTPEFRSSTVTTRFLDGFKPWEIALSPSDAEQTLIAAAISELLTAEEAQLTFSDPWKSLSRWRLLEQAGSSSRFKVTFEDDAGVSHEVILYGRAGSYRVERDGKVDMIQARQESGRLLLHTGAGSFTTEIQRRGTRRLITSGIAQRTLNYVDPAEVRGSQTVGSKAGLDITASIPGLIIEVLVEVGSVVELGQPVVLLEAMKMVHNLTASGPGVVSDVSCRAGDVVEMGRTLVRFKNDTGEE